jgi:hypothetical protein
MMENLIETTGKIVFDPQREDSFAPWWAMIELDCDMCGYYQWFLKKRFGVKLQKPLWGPHVSFVRGEECDKDKWGYIKALWNNIPVGFSYNPNVRTNGNHWWMNVQCEQIEQLRIELGLPRDSHFNLHLTIGSSNELNKPHSQYIHDICLAFDL